MRMLQKSLISVAVLALLIALPTWARDEDNGLRHQLNQVERDVRALQQALSAIQLTPGPQGPPGPEGDQGPQGVPGPAGAVSPITVTVEGLGGSPSGVPVMSGFDIFTQVDGIPGESKDAGHPNWIDTLGYSFGVTQTGTIGGGGGGTGRAEFQDFKILKVVDKATPKLFVTAASGEHIRDVTVEVGKSTDRGFQRLLKYVLTDVLISSVKPSGSSGGKLAEEISFNFARIEITYFVYKPDGSSDGEVRAGWDVKAGRQL